MDALLVYPWLFPCLVTGFGLIIGSFLNVVIYRLPQIMIVHWKQEFAETFPEYGVPLPEEESLTLSLPHSFCPHCHHKIRPWHNIPLVSWLLLGGKCADCHQRISVQYPIVELLSALASYVIAVHGGITLYTAALLLFTYMSIAAAFIDLNRMLLLDSLTIPLIWFALALSLFHISPVSLQDAVIGAIAGYLSLWSLYWAFKILARKEGMGYGDFKFLSALGAWLGWQFLPMVVLIASLTGIVLGVSLLLFKKDGENRSFPFGPSLAFAGWISLIWGQSLIGWYTSII